MKRCSKCDEEKIENEFCRQKSGKDGRAYWCRDCASKYRRAYRLANRFGLALVNTKTMAKERNYAPCITTVEEIQEAFTGLCHACGVPEVECIHNFHMDHDHETGEFRGWLCGHCNKALGFMGDSLDRAMLLVEYLKRATVLTPNS